MNADGGSHYPVADQVWNAVAIRVPGGSVFGQRRVCRRRRLNPNAIDRSNQERTDMNDTMGVAPAILRRHPRLDPGQLELIGHLEWPYSGHRRTGRWQDPGGGATRHEHSAARAGLAGRAVAVHLLPGRGPGAAGTFHWPGQRRRLRGRPLGGAHRHHPRPVSPDPVLPRQPHRSPAYFAVLNEGDQWRLLLRRYDDVFSPDRDVLEREGWRWRELPGGPPWPQIL